IGFRHFDLECLRWSRVGFRRERLPDFLQEALRRNLLNNGSLDQVRSAGTDLSRGLEKIERRFVEETAVFHLRQLSRRSRFVEGAASFRGRSPPAEQFRTKLLARLQYLTMACHDICLITRTQNASNSAEQVSSECAIDVAVQVAEVVRSWRKRAWQG